MHQTHVSNTSIGSFTVAPALSTPPSEQETPEAQWSYESAFSRNIGLVNEEEQERLRSCRVAIPGMGGVGGLHLATLARLGIGKFRIADPDCFESVNFNRQYGATVSSINRPKVDVMREVAKGINPQIEIEAISGKVDDQNAKDFLEDCDILVDGIDLYAIDARRTVFQEAAAQGLSAVTAGPMGFSTCWLTFDPNGMSFDRYFDISDDMSRGEKIIAFLMGLCPRMLPLKYMDRSKADPIAGCAPSVSAGCQLAAGVLASEVVKLLLGRGPVRPAPHYRIFDAYLGRFASGKLTFGNRGPIQQIKRKWLARDWKRRFETLDF